MPNKILTADEAAKRIKALIVKHFPDPADQVKAAELLSKGLFYGKMKR